MSSKFPQRQRIKLVQDHVGDQRTGFVRNLEGAQIDLLPLPLRRPFGGSGNQIDACVAARIAEDLFPDEVSSQSAISSPLLENPARKRA